jgi:hypothetical protein
LAESSWQTSALILQVRDEMAAVLDRITQADPIALEAAVTDDIGSPHAAHALPASG